MPHGEVFTLIINFLFRGGEFLIKFTDFKQKVFYANQANFQHTFSNKAGSDRVEKA